MAAEKKDFYKLLGITPRASNREIRSAYKELAREFHPDLHGEDADVAAQFSLINEAYSTLSNPEKRNAYNKENGYPFFEAIDLGGDGDFTYRDTTEEAASTDVPTFRRGEIRSTKSWDELRQSFDGHNLKVGDKVALQEDPTSAQDDGDEPISAWGGMEDAGQDSAGLFTKKGFRGLFGRKKDVSLQRSELKATLRRKLEEEAHPLKPPTPKKKATKESRGAHDNIDVNEARGEREYRFQITNLEAAAGTVRELAVPGAAGDDIRKVRVEIPIGVADGALLEVSQGWDRFQVRVKIVSDPFVNVDGANIVVTLPLTIREAMFGAELNVPTLHGAAKVSVPRGRELHKPIFLESRGLPTVNEGELGDLVVYPYIVLPSHFDHVALEALKCITKGYTGSVREAFGEDDARVINELDVVVVVPISVSEAIEGASVEVATPSGGLAVEIEPGFRAGKDFEFPGQGRVDEETGASGTLYVRPEIVLPEELTDEMCYAAEALEANYSFAVRDQFPSRLRPPTE